MKKILFSICAVLMVLSCGQNQSKKTAEQKADNKVAAEQTKVQQPLSNSVVYEMNVRQYTPKGTFAAAQKELPRLAEMGVDILWLMPIYLPVLHQLLKLALTHVH